MDKPNNDPKQIWAEYQAGVNYKNAINLYEDVEINTNFFHGKQWEGVIAPSIEKPVINLFKPAINYYTSMLASDDIGVTLDFPTSADPVMKETTEYIVTKMVDRVLEQVKFKYEQRQAIKEAAINGDAYAYWYFNPDKQCGQYKGDLELEMIPNTQVIFGNPSDHRIEKQPFMIIALRKLTSQVKDMVSDEAIKGQIVPDDEDLTTLATNAEANAEYTTILVKFWKDKEGSVWFTKTTQNVVLVKPTDMKVRLYPIAQFPWELVPKSCHGASPLTQARQNQITVNKYFMLVNEFLKKLAIPKIIFNTQKIKTWSNQVQAVGVDGDPQEAFVAVTPTAVLPPQVGEYAENLIAKTKEMLGIFDVALGNVQPDNTSAIIQLQKTASQPLELQKLNLYQFVEDCVRIIFDQVAGFYGVREVEFKNSAGTGTLTEFDFADLRDAFDFTVDVGAAAYWAETTQIQTVDNLFKNGIIPDAITYLEQLPDGVVKNKADIIQAIRSMQQPMPGQTPGMPGQPPAPDMGGLPPMPQTGVPNI